jgi:hypothetical protein
MRKVYTRRDFLKAAGISAAGLVLSGCDVNATKLPAATPMSFPPTETPTPTSTPNFTYLTNCINFQIDKLTSAYKLTDSNKETLLKCVKMTQLTDPISLNEIPIWIISSALLEQQDQSLAELLGDIPLAIQTGYETWVAPGFKDVTNIHVGCEFMEQENGSDGPMRRNFNFGVISSEWGHTAFGYNAPNGDRGWGNISDYIQLDLNGNAILQTDKLDFSWCEDFQARQALSHLGGSGRRLLLSHLIYPVRGSIPRGFELLNREQGIAIMTQYIDFTVNHLKDKFFAYNIVNEFYMTDDNDAQDVMLKVIGEDYIDIAFESVRKADPSALTILNQQENHIRDWDVNGIYLFQTTLRVANRLAEKGLIDMIGSQCHIDQGPGSPAYTNITEMTDVYMNYPVPVFISELDANTEQYADQPDRFLIQAQRVKGVLQAALASGTTFINLWGSFPDELSWLGPQTAATPWATGWKEKPMYFEILRTLFKNYAKLA